MAKTLFIDHTILWGEKETREHVATQLEKNGISYKVSNCATGETNIVVGTGEQFIQLFNVPDEREKEIKDLLVKSGIPLWNIGVR